MLNNTLIELVQSMQRLKQRVDIIEPREAGGILNLVELSADPSDPAEGCSVIWQSDGTGTGDDGDIMIKITAGGVTKITTLVDFSTI